MARETDLIAAIYDAAIDPAGWDEVLRRIVEATNSISGVILSHHIDPLARDINAVQVEAMCNVDPLFADAFIQTYYKINPLNPAAVAIAPGQVLAASPVTQTDSFRATPFYNEFLRPQGCSDAIGIGLYRTPARSEMLALHRSPDAVLLEPAQWRLLETLAPHLQRAASVHKVLSRANETAASLGAALTAAGFAVFVLTGDSRIVFANAKAEDLLRREAGLRSERGRLCATSTALTQRLHALLREAAQPARARPAGETGGTIELSRSDDCPPLLAHVIPLAENRAASIFDLGRPAAAVFIADRASGIGAQIQLFAKRFGLTPAETRVLGEIIDGNGLQSAAIRLKIAPATARTHADRIFEKTGTSRQTELIRRFFETSLIGSAAKA
jgi:DNA-binding CsgD family transcriptional regulator